MRFFIVTPMQKSRHYKKAISSFSLDEVFVARAYSSIVQQKLHRFKFAHNYIDSAYFASLFQEIREESGIVDFSQYSIVYPPVSLKDRIFRGPNHAKKLATIFAKISGTTHICCPLRKKFFAGHQSRRTKKDRKKTQHEYFFLNQGGQSLQDAQIILIDDIITTGYTAHTLGKLLKQAGARKVIGLFLSSKKA